MPRGTINDYRYSYEAPHHTNVPDAFEKTLQQLGRGTEVAVIYVDRKPTGYDYYPLRLGKFLTYRPEDGYLYITMEQGNFVYPKDPAGFKTKLVTALPTLPKLTNGDVNNTNDGHYALVSDHNVFLTPKEFTSREDAWKAAVEGISRTDKFKSTPTEHIVFVKGTVLEDGETPQEVEPENENDAAIFIFNPKKTYLLRLSYRFPIQNENKSITGKASIQIDETLRTLDETTVDINSFVNSFDIALKTKKHSKEHDGRIKLQWASTTTGATLIGPTGELRTKIRDGTLFWIQLMLLIIGAATCSVIVGADLEKIKPKGLCDLLMHEYVYPKIVAGVVGALCLLGIIRSIGEKVPG